MPVTRLNRDAAVQSATLRSVLPLVALVLAGCATNYALMPTPVLYTQAPPRPLFTNLRPEQQTPPLDLLYITDRAPSTGSDSGEPYTANRSRSMAFGSTTVEFGDVSWDVLASQSALAKRTMELSLGLGPTKELGRYPHEPYRIAETPTGLTRDPTFVDEHETADRELQAELERRLAIAPRKEVVMFVHGYHNTFQQSAMTMGELCHFLGREFVCAVFSWPAGGSRGLFFGYDVDLESSEFAVEHLKRAIRTIANTPGLQRLHLLAHSRGASILVTAVAELSAEAYITQTTMQRRFKLGNIVLMAPDIDADVAATKIFKVFSDPDLPYGKTAAPRVSIAPSPEFHVTIYASREDKALATSSWLFGSLARLGRLDPSSFTPQDFAQARMLGLFDVVEVRETNCFICHSYFVSNPRVSADIIAMLRYGLAPNEPGRPLIEVERPLWQIPTEAEASAAK